MEEIGEKKRKGHKETEGELWKEEMKKKYKHWNSKTKEETPTFLQEEGRIINNKEKYKRKDKDKESPSKRSALINKHNEQQNLKSSMNTSSDKSSFLLSQSLTGTANAATLAVNNTNANNHAHLNTSPKVEEKNNILQMYKQSLLKPFIKNRKSAEKKKKYNPNQKSILKQNKPKIEEVKAHIPPIHLAYYKSTGN